MRVIAVDTGRFLTHVSGEKMIGKREEIMVHATTENHGGLERKTGS